MLLSACLVVLVPGKEVSKSLLPRKKKKTLNLSEYRSPPTTSGGEEGPVRVQDLRNPREMPQLI